jgi:hypothetical protein
MKILRSLSLSLWVLSALCISNLVDWADVDGETLNVTQDAYVVLEHEAFPQHSVRIKPVTVCSDISFRRVVLTRFVRDSVTPP